MRRLITLMLAALAASCMTMTTEQARFGYGHLIPGLGVTDRQKVEHCGSVEEFERRYSEITPVSESEALAAGERGYATPQVPRVGWDSCQVLVRLGVPNDTRSTEVEGSFTWSWFYESRSGLHLVSLRPAEDGVLEVTGVSW